MKNLFICLIIILGLNSCDDTQDVEFSLQGTLIEDCESGKPVAGKKMILVCRNEKGDDKTIPFTTDSAGKFYVKGEPNGVYYFVTESYNSISSGFEVFDGMAAKHYNIGKTMARFSKTAYYPVVVKYDVSSSAFKEGDSIIVNTDILKLNNPVKTSFKELSKSDTQSCPKR